MIKFVNKAIKLNREQIAEQVIFLAESIVNCDVTEQTQLDEVADSLDLVMGVERECKVDIFDEDAFKMKTTADLIDYVNTKLNGNP